MNRPPYDPRPVRQATGAPSLVYIARLRSAVQRLRTAAEVCRLMPGAAPALLEAHASYYAAHARELHRKVTALEGAYQAWADAQKLPVLP